MESETANLLERQPAAAGTKPISIRPSESANVSRSFTTATPSSSSSSQSDLIRHIQAIKRPRPLGTMQSNVLMPRRSVAPQRGASKGSTLNTDCALDTKKTQDEISLSHRLMECISQPKNIGSVTVEDQEDASMPPSEYGSTVDAHEENYNSFNSLRDQPRSFAGRRSNITAASSVTECEHVLLAEGQKRVHFAADSTSKLQDKRLLDEVMNGSMSNNESRVKEDGYIYMVLEYGEIDLAHMLSQKWKELDDSDSIIDENWLRFYWQQILLAVNTIHEERIVHSDLKPANFLLVRGSLKLIDFGIAKAIMSDTTNIQRDSQVGTLSYMSPEAFMCNETDANGNTIKCGRPSDIWSLGCILYQMVYGRTPFAEYKTFWAKFKVITDPNHEITYEPLSNPWLLDLMKKCLAWDRNERWRIPQLLQHPFLVPPVPPQLPAPPEQSCTLLQLIAKSCENDGKASMLCMQLQNLLVHPSQISHEALTVCQYQKLLCDVSALCLQLQKQLGNTERGTKM